MRPKLLLLDEPCDKAKEIFAQEFELSSEWKLPDLIYTQLTPVKTICPVVCPCTGIEHVKASDVIYLDDGWKLGEGKLVTSTAEHTWSLILQLAKIKRMQLSNKAIGIIGYGRIGKIVGGYSRAFGMRVFYNDFIKTSPYGFKVLPELLSACDIITLHVPLNESTKGMIGKDQFKIMKPDALLINTSRPEIINEYDLIDALEYSKIGGFADDFYSHHVIDVIEHITDYPNVISSNHIGGNCIEAREATDVYIANKAIEYWRSKNP